MVHALVADITLEEKVGGLLMVHVHGDEDARVLIQEVGVGGVIYYDWCNPLHTLGEIKCFSDGLQKLAKVPLLIAADQEGGRVCRFKDAFTKVPENGEMKNPKCARVIARLIGNEMHVAGINMNLAPVVDVNSNPNNPVIGGRAYSSDPLEVAIFGKEALKGYQDARIITTLKHFPGHGDTEVDSHEGVPMVNKSLSELESMGLVPFRLLASEADAIMTAHILVPALDPDNCATLSKNTIGYLRETIGFQGVVITDSLVMEGVLKKCKSVDEAAIQALNAGCDILLLGGKLLSGEKSGFELSVNDIKRIHRAILEAVMDGRILESRIDEARARVMNLRLRLPKNADIVDIDVGLTGADDDGVE